MVKGHSQPLDERILDTAARVVFIPVRHHSPACARLVAHFVRALRPGAVLIEGPSDFNDRIVELFLPHRLPVAIYSYVKLADDSRRGAYYPFCHYSPEWQALQCAREVGAEARFIDCPWADVADTEVHEQRFNDGELRFSQYVAALCRETGAPDFDALWDTMFEISRELDPPKLFQRLHLFCANSRACQSEIDAPTLRREAFMAREIVQAAGRISGTLFVVTGGFHSAALFRLVSDCNGKNLSSPAKDTEQLDRPTVAERGISLTPYSYQRLDSLTGYEAGMPGPGFYHRIWEDRTAGRPDSYRGMLFSAAQDLRARKQAVSSADLIAVDAMTRALAALRGHEEPWREDLIDGIVSALVKDELCIGVLHPFLEALHETFRGKERGELAEGTALPALVTEIHGALQRHNLFPEPLRRDVSLGLRESAGMARSQLLHAVRFLGISGFDCIQSPSGATDVAPDSWDEIWRICWTPDFDSSCIESASYGPDIPSAVSARLLERARLNPDAATIASLLHDAVRMGCLDLASNLKSELALLIHSDRELIRLTRCLDELIHLCRYDPLYGTGTESAFGELLDECFQRAVWLLDGIGSVDGNDSEHVASVAVLVQSLQLAPDAIHYAPEDLAAVLQRVASGAHLSPQLRGAAAGGLWSLGHSNKDLILQQVRLLSDPQHLGDYLLGLFLVAREEVQRNPDVVTAIDESVMEYTDEGFLQALPSLRLAFSFFTPREKHYLALTLLRATGEKSAQAMLTADVETAARALLLEGQVFDLMRLHGIRGELS